MTDILIGQCARCGGSLTNGHLCPGTSVIRLNTATENMVREAMKSALQNTQSARLDDYFKSG